jgi:hypothetical protein
MEQYLVAQEVSGLSGPAMQMAESRKDIQVVSRGAFAFHVWEMKIVPRAAVK